MVVYAIAMAEVKEGSVLCGADTLHAWDDAVDAADDFMMRCVGDFYDINGRKARRHAREARVSRERSVFKGRQKLECCYRDPLLDFVVTTCVQEVEL